MSRSSAVTTVLFLGVALRLSILIIVLYFDPYRVLEGTDSLSFYIDAIHIAVTGSYYPWEPGWMPYVNVMGAIMSVLGTNIAVMFLMSIGAWLISALMIDKALAILGASSSYRLICALIISFMPSVLLATSIPMRESFQLLGITLMTFGAVGLAANRGRLHWLFIAGGAAIASTLHLSLVASAATIALLAFLLNGFRKGSVPVARTALVGVAAIGALGMFMGIVESRYGGTSGSLLDSISSFRETGASLDARAQYSDGGVTQGAGGIVGMITGFVQYMVQPLPWRVGTVGDIIVFLENVVRLALIFGAVGALRRTSGFTRWMGIFFLTMYLASEFFWSTGTINWGTAARHHVPSIPLLLIAASVIDISRRTARNMARLPVRSPLKMKHAVP